MPYTQVRYIGYEVSTVGINSGLASTPVYGIPPGTVTNPPKLSGVTGDLSKDARTRVERLIGALYLAKKKIKATDSDQTLKVFMAPEFYFRPETREVAYSMKEYRAIKQALRETIGDDKSLEHWLVLPGTILWKMSASDSALKTKRVLGQVTWEAYFNTTLYIKQVSNPFKPPQSKVIEKAFASSIDGLPTGKHDIARLYHVDDKKKDAPSGLFYPRYQGHAKRHKHVFTLDAVNFGVEICLEHACRVLKSVLQDQRRDKRPFSQIDLHLLTAGGMPLNEDYVAARNNGYILRNDGLVTDAKKPAVELQKILSYKTRCSSDKDATPANTESIANLEKPKTIPAFHPFHDKHPLYLKPPVGCENLWRKQGVFISRLHSLP